MNWNANKKYKQISLYVIFTIVVSYILLKIFDSASYLLINAHVIVNGVGNVFSYIFNVFAVLIIALILAYLLDPLVGFFQDKFDMFYIKNIEPRLKKRTKKLKKAKKTNKNLPIFKIRTAGTAITFTVFLLGIIIIVFIISSKISSSGANSSVVNVDATTNSGLLSNLNNALNKNLIEIENIYSDSRLTLKKMGLNERISDMLSETVEALINQLKGLSKNFIGIIGSISSGVMNFFLALLICFYILRDKDYLFYKTNDVCSAFLPPKVLNVLSHFFGDINAVFSGYIRGQFTDAAIMSILISTVLSLIGVPFAIFIGVFSGISNLIPYFGAIVAFVLSVGVTLLTGTPEKAIWAGIAILVLQQIDGMFIVPKVVGEKVELSPALVLLSLSVFGAMFGLIGMVFAVPVCAILKIYLHRLTERRKNIKLTEIK